MDEGVEIRAVSKYVRMSSQKVRLVINQVRGKRVDEALTMLKFMPQAAAKPVYKTIRSAVANAEENEGLDGEHLYIDRITADVGPTRRWRRFGARGRFKPIRKRSTHITVVLKEGEVE